MLVTIVHSAATGHPAEQASAVAEGARSVPGVQARLVDLSAEGVPWETLESSGAIIFGSATHRGTVSPEVKRFFRDSWTPVGREGRWRNKVAAGFTSSGARRHELETLVELASFAARHGMVWVGLDLLPASSRGRAIIPDPRRDAGGLGAMTASCDDEGPAAIHAGRDVRAAAYLGRRAAELARRLRRGT